MKNVSEIAKAIRVNGIKVGQERLVKDLERFVPVVHHNRTAIYEDTVINALCYQYTGELQYYFTTPHASKLPSVPKVETSKLKFIQEMLEETQKLLTTLITRSKDSNGSPTGV